MSTFIASVTPFTSITYPSRYAAPLAAAPREDDSGPTPPGGRAAVACVGVSCQPTGVGTDVGAVVASAAEALLPAEDPPSLVVTVPVTVVTGVPSSSTITVSGGSTISPPKMVSHKPSS